MLSAEFPLGEFEYDAIKESIYYIYSESGE